VACRPLVLTDRSAYAWRYNTSIVEIFDGIEGKIDRSGEHIDTLNREIAEWAQGHPYSVASEPHGQSTHHRIYVRLHKAPDVRRWGLLLGDAVHNLRSALDHLVYAGAICVTGQNPPPDERKLQFVVVDALGEWLAAQQQRHMRPLTDEMRTFIESLQPYKSNNQNDPNGYQLNLLRWVRELDDADKHRAIRPVFITPGAFQGYVRTISGGAVTFHMPLTSIEDGATLMNISGEATTEVEPNMAAALGIGVSVIPEHPELPRLIHEALDLMFNCVVGVAHQFRERFLE
jgi:hypothetical protein